ncbi:hypothetical protein [Macrococcus animalis]|uniref:hypothetical protein n=1 Tax=Macrococcus animalis TaxID=3395467 RepID=UPI0039BE7866
MSDIIIFPKLQGNLMKQIKVAMASANYESAYDLFNDYEKHFELTEDEHLIKLDCLYQLESFLELREESSILLNQGHYAYDKIIPYFIESLLKLKQYKTVVELIDSLRSEDVDHRVIVTLMPFYDEAHHQMNKRNDAHMKFIQTFKENDMQKQIDLILELIESEDFRFQMSFIQILEHNQLHPIVSSMMIEYLVLSEFKGEVKLNKHKQSLRLNMTEVPSMVNTKFMKEVVTFVAEYYESNSPSVIHMVIEMMKQHNTIIYPISIEDYFKCEIDSVKAAYIEMFNDLLNLSNKTENLRKDSHMNTIETIIALEKYNILNEY